MPQEPLLENLRNRWDWHPARSAEFCSRGRWKFYPHLVPLADALMDVAGGHCDRLIVSMPPRHGKSQLTSCYFPAWYLGVYPDRNVILTSYNSEYAAEWGRKTRDVISEFGPELWGISVNRETNAAARWRVAGHLGGMYSVGAMGSLTGRGGELIVIDDPIKNAEEAASETFRNKLYEWYQTVLMTRLQRGGAIVLVMTRWHEDDLAGRLLKAQADGTGDTWRHIKLPAMAEENDPLGRPMGAALCPELIPQIQLEAIRNSIGEYGWATLYQQRPYPRGGGLFRPERIEIVTEEQLKDEQFEEPVRAWDIASSTALKNDRSAGVKMAYWPRRKKWLIMDAAFGRWAPEDRNNHILQKALMDGYDVRVLVEKQPGAAGVDFCNSMTELLSAWSVEHIRANGSKEVRADPFAGQVNIGRVAMLKADWNQELLRELEAFPSGDHDDIVDACVHAYTKLSRSSGGSLPHYSPGWDGRMRLQADNPDDLERWKLLPGHTMADEEPDINTYGDKEVI